MKNMKRIFSLVLALAICLCSAATALAAPVADATIDTTAKGSLTVYKYDLTNAEKDGVWDSSYVSTGVYDAEVNKTLGEAVRVGDDDTKSDLGNGEQSFGYAIKGVEFTYLKVAEIVQFTESAADNRSDSHVEVLYGINKVQGADFLKALGLENGAGRYTNADHMNADLYYYQSDVLIDALRAGLEANATVVKNALEKYIAAYGGTKMPLTDSYGESMVENLDLGLYLVVETAVPEMVTCTCNPFLVSMPMTSVNGNNATDGGTRWIYDVTIYPKNLTGIPTLEKTLREQLSDTGKNSGSTTDITDGYAHIGTASTGDVIDYQIISTLPSITSKSTYLTCYTFVDTLSAGLTYNGSDVVLEFFTDEACTDRITTWREADGMFTVNYGTTDENESVMTIEMTDRGLAEINTAKTVYPQDSMVNSGYSDCTLRITYQATMDSDNSVTFGDNGNPNDVVLTWKRSNTSFYDTLVDDAHVYTYGIDLTKRFSNNNGDFANVAFVVYNETDGYFVQAQLNEAEGIYYVTEHVQSEEDATQFVPVNSNGNPGKVIIKGLEDDTYIITETRTDNGYVLLKDNIKVVISQTESETLCGIYGTDAAGLIQNDPRYAQSIIDQAIAEGYMKTNGNLADILHNMPQKHLEHRLLTASATVDGNAVTMLDDNGSVNAHAPLIVVNTRGFDLPETGDHGVWMYGLIGFMVMTGASFLLILASRKKETIE